MKSSLHRSSLALLLTLTCVSSAAARGGSSWEETTAVPVRVRPGPPAPEDHPWRALSPEEREKESEARVYRVEAFGEELVLRLEPDRTFLAPGFVFHVVGRGPEEEESGPPPAGAEPGCFYSGTVNGDARSVAALNLCGGLTGGFYLRGLEYFIQPARNASDAREPQGEQDGEEEEEEEEVVHAVRRRSLAPMAEEEGGGGSSSSPKCGVNEDEPRVPENLDAEKVVDGGGAASTSSSSSSSSAAGGKAHSRRRRFVSTPRYLEVMLVADQSMAEFHGAGLKPYLLTIMAVASRLYRHPTIRNSVSLAVVKLLVVYEEERGPQVSSNAALTLRNFCQWQRQHNPASDRHPEHYDTAVLFTRTDLCGAHSCDTLGMADVGTVCDPERSCSIVEDDGLQAAFTVAHELGHVFNMPHDDAQLCSGVNGDHWGSHMMASTLSNLDQQQPWSPCSALMVTTFLDNGHGQCLLDKPAAPQPLPAALPGTVYDADRQCRLTFGEGSQHCPDLSTTCAALWCTVTTSNGLLVCQTKNFPWADGTGCGADSYCLAGHCLTRAQAAKHQTPVNGGWGLWGPWGDCSRTCGGGVQYSFRDCDSPLPRNAGKYCEGKRIQYRSCNTEVCPDNNGLTFREEQCLAHNDMSGHMTFNSRDGVEWEPKYSGVSPKDRCKLMCRAKGTGYFFILKSKVADGTPCSPDSTSVCVQGQCVKAGCDRVIGSSRRFDKCGVCGGDGSTCKKVSGSMEHARHGYQDVVTIPAGATHVDVKQRAPGNGRPDNSYLAVRRAGGGGYLLNGNYKLTTQETDVALRGAVLRYSGSMATLERLRSHAPLPEALTVQVLSVGDAPRPRVKFSYFAPRPVSAPRGGGGGGGASRRAPSINAIREAGGAEWTLGEWGPCSRTCGGGAQQREVLCLDPRGRSSRECPGELRPPGARACQAQACPASWLPGPWSSCSTTCGRGYRKRALRCLGAGGATVTPESCEPKDRPRPLLELCHQGPC